MLKIKWLLIKKYKKFVILNLSIILIAKMRKILVILLIFIKIKIINNYKNKYILT